MSRSRRASRRHWSLRKAICRPAKRHAGGPGLLQHLSIHLFRNHEIAVKRGLSDDDVVEVLRKAIKRRRESVEMYEQGGRAEQAAAERREAEALEAYLPAAPSDDEVRAAVRAAVAAGASKIGAVMGKVMPQFKGRLDGSVLNRIAREELGPQA